MANDKGQGRKPKPTYLKLLEGEPNKRRINKNEPKVEKKRPPCPRFLSRDAKKMWKYLAPQLECVGVLTRVDLAVFASFCQAYGRWKDAEEKLTANGHPLYKTPKGHITTSPYLWVANKAMDQMNKFGSELGLTPASRTRIRAEVDSGGELEELFT